MWMAGTSTLGILEVGEVDLLSLHHEISARSTQPCNNSNCLSSRAGLQLFCIKIDAQPTHRRSVHRAKAKGPTSSGRQAPLCTTRPHSLSPNTNDYTTFMG
eukprot:IDg3020t1